MDLVIAYKLLAVPVVVLTTSFLAKKWGAFVGGIFAGLPIFSGPISFFMTLEQGAEFGLVASYNSMIGLLCCVTTALLYAWLAYFRLKWWFALPCSIIGYFGAGFFFYKLPQFSVLIIILAFCSALIAGLSLPKPAVKQFHSKKPHWVPWAQIVFGAFMVYGVTEAAQLLGPKWSGNMSCFPIMIILLAPFTHIVNGVYATVAVLRGFTAGWFGTAVFSYTVILTVMHWHIAFVYIFAAVCACAGTLLYSLALVHVSKKIARKTD